MKGETVSQPADSKPYFNREDTALILHFQRLSTEDGTGIRTTVFFKGCPLQCGWCHNPESISPKPQVHWLETRCIGCGKCTQACVPGCLKKNGATITRDRSKCTVCGKCTLKCPAGAQEMLGKEISLQQLLAVLIKDRVYYEKSGGGVTLSGGEPLLQPLFAASLLKALKENGIQTAIDTCGLCPPSALQKVLPFTGIFLFDIKEIDPELHKELTGQDNRRILENLGLVRDYIKAHGGTTLWIRTPLIPGATASRRTVERIGRYLHDNLEGYIQRWELCAFNNLCRDKYLRLGLEWKYADTPLLSKEELAEFESIARQSGPDPALVFATGETRVETPI